MEELSSPERFASIPRCPLKGKMTSKKKKAASNVSKQKKTISHSRISANRDGCGSI
jgi:hypothetical protein